MYWIGRLYLAMVAAPVFAIAGTAQGTGTGGPIPAPPATSGIVTSNIVISGSGNVAAGNAITVTLLGLQHDFAGDLQITLSYIASNGTTVQSVDLVNRLGATSTNSYGTAADFGNNQGAGDNYVFNSDYTGNLWNVAACADPPNCTEPFGDADSLPGVSTDKINSGQYFPSTIGGAKTNLSYAFAGLSVSGGTWRLTITDAADPNAGSFIGWQISIVTVATGGGPTPSTFTTYLGPYGSGSQTFSGASAVLPLRAYVPGGAAQLAYFWTNFNAVSNGATEYQIYAISDGAGGYVLHISDGANNAPAWPFLTLTASGNTVTLPTSIVLGNMQITAYRFALAGNEFQLDLSITRSGTFNDQLAILASYGQNYSSPWSAVDGQWSASSVSGPAVTLSSTSLNFGAQSTGTTVSLPLTVKNSGTAPLAIGKLQLAGANASDFTATGCTSNVAAGGTCTISVSFVPAAVGSRSATLSVTDNAANSPQTVSLTGTGSAAATPATFTTYITAYGGGPQTFSGTSAVLPLRAYVPGGASQLTYFWVNFNAVSNSATEFQVYVISDGSGGYVLHIFDGTNNAPAWPFLTLNPSGSTITLATPITLGAMKITAYRFALAGNEFQLDLSVTRSGTFSDQLIVLASYGQNYSAPWYGVDGHWSNP